MRRVAVPLEVVETLVEATDLGVDGRASRLADVDLTLQRPPIVLDLCLVFEVKLILRPFGFRLVAGQMLRIAFSSSEHDNDFVGIASMRVFIVFAPFR